MQFREKSCRILRLQKFIDILKICFSKLQQSNHGQKNITVFNLQLRTLILSHAVGFFIRFDLPSTYPASDSPLGVLSLSLLTTYSIFRIRNLTLQMLFEQRSFHLYYNIFTRFIQLFTV